MSYLHQGEGVCQFAIARNPLDKFNSGNYIFGDLFLKHFYSIYDYDQEMISLGVNTHSADQVSMYPAGQKSTAKASGGKSTATAAPADKKSAPKASEAVTDTFTMAAASEQLAGKKAQEGVKSLNSDPHEDLGEFEKNDDTKKEEKPKEEGVKSSGESSSVETKVDEAKKHKVIVETKAVEAKPEGEKAKTGGQNSTAAKQEKIVTEVMPEAKATEKVDLKKLDENKAQPAVAAVEKKEPDEDKAQQALTDQWANAKVDSKEFLEKNGDLKEAKKEEAKTKAEKSKSVEEKKDAEAPAKTENKPEAEAKPEAAKPEEKPADAKVEKQA